MRPPPARGREARGTSNAHAIRMAGTRIAQGTQPPAACARPFGDYEILTSLARGGTSRVVLAAHAETGERVALKVLVPEFAAHGELATRLHGELALVSRTAHPGLVEIYRAERTADGTPYLVMEYLAGETLGTLAERAPLAPVLLLAIAAQVAAALAALHAAGVVHCDVKHDNVIVLDEQRGGMPRVKVIDFGVSRGDLIVQDAEPSIAGTPWCMAPEQWRGRPEPASDVYSLGCLLYDLVTGHAPFEGSLPALMAAHMEERPARPSWFAPTPPALERLILRMLAKAPAARPAMADVAAALLDQLDALPRAPADGPGPDAHHAGAIAATADSTLLLRAAS